MGEAKRRANEISKLRVEHEQWLEKLTAPEKEILLLAERLEERLVRAKGFTGGCYHLAFFMTRYLADKGIEVKPVVGWVDDGTWEGVASHAWIDFHGRKTDVSMTRTEHPVQQPPGAMIVLDRVLKKGQTEYTYYENDDPRALTAIAMQRKNQMLGALQAHKGAQHRQMMSIAEVGHMERIDAYLAQAPQGLKFDDLKRLVG